MVRRGVCICVEGARVYLCLVLLLFSCCGSFAREGGNSEREPGVGIMVWLLGSGGEL